MVDGRGTPASNNSLQTGNRVPRLRAMGFGELLDTIFSVYRTHFRTFLGIAIGYFIAMLIGVSISFFDNAMGRDTKVVLWILNHVLAVTRRFFLRLPVASVARLVTESALSDSSDSDLHL